MLNPILYTEKVVKDFLKYQITTYPFADKNLYEQMRQLLNLEHTRNTPLFQGPYISLSRSFRQGASIKQLVNEQILHPHFLNLCHQKNVYPHLYGHQEDAVRAIAEGQHTLVSTGTGSGKTECFLYPILNHCLQLNDQNAPEGITAIIVYPMNALAEDQLGRLRKLLAGSGISFGMYIGKTPEKRAGATGKRLDQGASQADYQKALEKAEKERQPYTVYPPEERPSREEQRQNPPRILLTNIKQLELLLTRQKDVELFQNVQLQFLVFDEAHTFSGTAGAETACLIRRLRTFCQKSPSDLTCIATSATLADPLQGLESGREFATRFFGVPREQVVLVGEKYQDDLWGDRRQLPPALADDPDKCLKNVLEVLEEANKTENEGKIGGNLVKGLLKAVISRDIDSNHWQESLYQCLANNELVFQLAHALKNPRLITELVADLELRLERPLSEAEILLWLALGAASRQEGRPLLRPVLHGFIRGISGAVVTFPKLEDPDQRDKPKLWLSAEDAIGTNNDGLYRLPVTTCTTCGQHYFIHFVQDFQFEQNHQTPGGGQASGTRVLWKPLSSELGGSRLLLLDRRIVDDDDDLLTDHPDALALTYFCRHCGTLHSSPLQRTERKSEDRCDTCGSLSGLIPLYVVRQRSQHPGKLTACVTCQTLGRFGVTGYREPSKEVRATTVSDVHVLAQNMIHHSDRQRLLVFADNRQDAAFQAGWMQDHARRYRLRGLMYDQIQRLQSVSVGDLTAYLDQLLDQDDDLSRSLLSEVWDVARKEQEGVTHQNERKYFLRIQILREITTGVKQRIGLEPWGRLRIEYAGLSSDSAFIQTWSNLIAVAPQDLVNGIAALLDVTRRSSLLWDQDGRIFSQFWQEGNREVLRGYLPLLQGVPKGLKLRREGDDDRDRVQQWLSQGGQTAAMKAARRWGVPPELIPDFLEQLWDYLTHSLNLLVPVILTGKRGRPLNGCTGVYQIDTDRLRLTAHQGLYRCQVCRRIHLRDTPRHRCMGYRCQDGVIAYEPENPDDYDLMVLDQQFSMLRAKEHSAQVPVKKREELETKFKGHSQQINTLVCTPTLEMGVDIGGLDSVLMRNVPPLPANYWQRVGRAGRQHRLAVNLTYCRQASHDRSYFSDPLKLLQGIITPPRFNLRNGVMLQKHIHATVLTALYQLVLSPELSETEQQEIQSILDFCFPVQVKSYLFDEQGHVLDRPRDVSGLQTLLKKYQSYIETQLISVFQQDPELKNSLSNELLSSALAHTTQELRAVIQRLWKRLQWARAELDRLEIMRQKKLTLDPDEEYLRKRCTSLINKLKGIQSRKKREAEGYDDTITYGVLASEGFLPGYGLEIGSILATALFPRMGNLMQDFELPRPTATALREYMPGNLIYANSNRFVPRRYHLEPEQQLTVFQVDISQEAIQEIGLQGGGGLSTNHLRAIPLCDVDLPHQSHISDEEIYRFQLPVTILGYEQSRHNGGQAYTWGEKNLLFRKGLHLRLVNIGAANLVNQGQLGYPLCTVCGQSRSPLSSSAEIDRFIEAHADRCRQNAVQSVGFYTDVVADSLTLQNCGDRTEAYSIAEALRLGASRILEMEIDDLQLLAIGHPGEEVIDILLYDPMPGGSGLLEQVLEKWTDILSQALAVVQVCPSHCETACIDCLMTYRNAYYHRYLNRHKAQEKLTQWGSNFQSVHNIPPLLPQEQDKTAQPTNNHEARFQKLLLRLKFPEPLLQYPIDLGRPLGTTTPDFFYLDPDGVDEGICIYLDGMSKRLHGDPERQKQDANIRAELESLGYQVFSIPATALDDRTLLTRHLSRLGKILLGKEEAQRIKNQTDWFDDLSPS